MHTVHAPKKTDNTIRIEVDPFARRGRFVNVGKAGRHKDKRRKAKVNERVDSRKDW